MDKNDAEKVCMMGWQAGLALDALTYQWSDLLAAEDEVDYGTDDLLEQLDAQQLLNLVRQVSERLLAMGVSQEDIQSHCSRVQSQEPLRITDNYRIFLPHRGNTEIVLRPLVKALFVLFLKHPEGIRFKDLSDYRSELGEIYGRISHRSDLDGIAQSVERLVNPLDNAVNISRSRLSRSLADYFDKSSIGQYLIQGASGQVKSIPLDRHFVIWE